jgi:hypothetical protein
MAKILRSLEDTDFDRIATGWVLPQVDAIIVSQSEGSMVRASMLSLARPEVEVIRYYNVLTKPVDLWHAPFAEFVRRYVPAVPNVRFPWFGNPEVWDWSRIGEDLQLQILEWMVGSGFPASRFFLDQHWKRPADWMFDAPVQIDGDAWERNITDCFEPLISPIANGDQTHNSTRYLENSQAVPEPGRSELWRLNPQNVLSFNVDRCAFETYEPYFAQPGWMAFTCDYPQNDDNVYAIVGQRRTKELAS